MNRVLLISLTAFLFSLLTGSAWAASGQNSSASKLDERVTNSLRVLKEIQKVPEKGIPDYLLSNCYGLAVFPSVYKGGFMIGASYGKGILVARNPKTGMWSGPVFLTIGGGSFGWQIGVEATDLVLVITNKHGLESLLKNKIGLGGDLSVAAGPVGRQMVAATDLSLKAEIYSYSRSKGFFAGIALKGAYLKQDYMANELYYHRSFTPREILFNHVTPPGSGQALLRWLNSRSRAKGS